MESQTGSIIPIARRPPVKVGFQLHFLSSNLEISSNADLSAFPKGTIGWLPPAIEASSRYWTLEFPKDIFHACPKNRFLDPE
jgi:hypothetical protein